MRYAVRFVIPGPPVPKARARFAGGHAFTPASTRKFEQLVGAMPVKGPIRVVIECFVADNRRRDLDNMFKSVMDGLNHIAFEDDSQVCDIRAILALVEYSETHPEKDDRVKHPGREVEKAPVHLWSSLLETGPFLTSRRPCGAVGGAVSPSLERVTCRACLDTVEKERHRAPEPLRPTPEICCVTCAAFTAPCFCSHGYGSGIGEDDACSHWESSRVVQPRSDLEGLAAREAYLLDRKGMP